jgi:hypothetical protein
MGIMPTVIRRPFVRSIEESDQSSVLGKAKCCKGRLERKEDEKRIDMVTFVWMIKGTNGV